MHLLQGIFLAGLISCVCQTGAKEFLGIRSSSADGSQTARLVTSGWYRVVRHPLYLLLLLFLLSNPVMTVRWLILILFSAVYCTVGALLEERRLLQQFGDHYRLYQKQVPFMIPRIFHPGAMPAA